MYENFIRTMRKKLAIAGATIATVATGIFLGKKIQGMNQEIANLNGQLKNQAALIKGQAKQIERVSYLNGKLYSQIKGGKQSPQKN